MDKKIKKTGNIKIFLPYYKKYIWVLILDLICASLTTLCELILPLIVRSITDVATTNLSALTSAFILRCGILYLILRLIDTGAYYYMSSCGHVMGAKIETDLRRDMFSHLQKLSFSYYDETKIGSIMSRITSDLFDITEFAHHCPEEFFIAAIKIVASFSILCSMNVWLTLIIFAIIPPMAVILTVCNQKMREGFKESRVKIGELNAQVEDSLLGIRVVKSFANENVEKEKFNNGNQGFLKIKAKVYKYMGIFHSSTRFFDGAMYIIVVVAGAFFLKNGKISPADLVAYLLFVSTLLTSIHRIVEFAEQFQRGITGIERFSEIMNTEPQITDCENAKELKNVLGNIDFEDVSFKYNKENEKVLDHLNLSIKAGENIALVGPSGGGKTTIAALIPRFYEINNGKIKIDGQDIKGLKLSFLRNNIGIVQQDVYLFSGTIKENIAYGKIGASEEEIINAAKLAGAFEFISKLPNGFDTYVGERGVKLSGGQKQRISIARVFLKNPPILILDEATSALDNESERLVQHSLAKLSEGRTTLTIAHRLTTIKNADKIIVLDGGKILESGNHSELMALKGAYFELYNTYN